ncbi:hypothetical protein SAMN05421548_108172 [Paraburkholderia lycopersici]|uniref:Uncharacterized protein n=1 Tax=Paraburkholderia lycopersici TaxID=416944 RepID=A0A1G6N370_9BURK|nr:hypothetical protein SAMN05421548_108172 [Paraburkholderia lycopersici]
MQSQSIPERTAQAATVIDKISLLLPDSIPRMFAGSAPVRILQMRSRCS